LDQAHGDFIAAQGNPNVNKHAPLELKQSADALAQADAAARKRESIADVDKLAYIAKQKIALAQEVAKQKSAEAVAAAAARERDQLRLDARTAEADTAKAKAEQATVAAQAAQGQTAEAIRQAQEAQLHAAELERQLADLAAKKTDRGMVITLGDVLFATNSTVMSQSGMGTVQKLANVLQQNPQRTVLIEGYTDSTGSTSYNQQLSERRAQAVRDALVAMGVSRSRVDVRGLGPAFPVASNGDAQGRQLNRRVEIILSDESGRVAQR
jgi:outer membrane protein OmpA-like peptidoglycan-associated protein